jgi:CheY-like chemotaxis protein
MSMRRHSVLYVEDNEINAMLMEALFMERRPDVDLVVVATGKDAICKVQQINPSLLLLDLRLPDCHGTALLPLLRMVSTRVDTPAIAVTADGVFDIAATGFKELWTKPLDLGAVLTRLDQILGPLEQPELAQAAR